MMKVIRILKKKEFRELDDNNKKLVGYTKYTKWNDERHKNKQGYTKLVDGSREYVVKEKYHGFTKEYICIGNDEYICVKNKVCCLFLLLLMLSLCIGGWFMLSDNSSVKPDIKISGEDIQPYHPIDESEDEMIEVPGFSKSYTVSAKNSEIYLTNPEGNTVLFKYTLSENGHELTTTDYIKPNKMVRANLYKLLGKGTHQIDMLIETVDKETYAVCNSASQSIEIIVK